MIKVTSGLHWYLLITITLLLNIRVKVIWTLPLILPVPQMDLVTVSLTNPVLSFPTMSSNSSLVKRALVQTEKSIMKLENSLNLLLSSKPTKIRDLTFKLQLTQFNSNTKMVRPKTISHLLHLKFLKLNSITDSVFMLKVLKLISLQITKSIS